jgi:hypothetical protein
MRKSLSILGVMLLAASALGGCSKTAPSEAVMASAPVTAPAAQAPVGGGATPGGAGSPIAGKQASLPQSARKVIRSAELSFEVKAPGDAELRVFSLVEAMGGYVASSEHQEERVVLSLRVPSARMEEALREIRRLSLGRSNEKIGSEDVTDEYIDLDAHIVNQRKLETQISTILATANTVDGALKVHHELTAVRTEIDRLEGRRRFLESESTMAKIGLTINAVPKPPKAEPMIAVEPVTFWSSVRDAVAESIAVARAIFTGLTVFVIRAAGVVLPVLVMFGLPVVVAFWWLKRRQRRLLLQAD